MKQLLLLVVLCSSLTGFGQEKENEPGRQRCTATEKATLQTKKMTLDLVLTDAQREAIFPLVLAKTKQRETSRQSKKNVAGSDRFQRINERLDAQIAFQNKMKNILDPGQFDIWKKRYNRHVSGRHHREMNRRKRHAD